MKRFFHGGGSYGRLALLIGVLSGVPLLVIPFYPQDAKYAPAFLAPAAFSLLLGLLLNRLSPPQEEEPREWQSSLQKGSLPVLFVWFYSFIAGAAPFFLGGQLDVIKALFEAISGWTTAGLTVVDVTRTPHIYLFHRSFMQYCGGLGFIIMMSALVQSKQSVNLYNAEGHYERLMPNLKRTSRIITTIYAGVLAAGTVLYRVFGMPVFDAVCHTMSAVSTAGFSTQAGSIGAYNSRPIEIITIVIMLIGASNFAVLLLLSRGKMRRVARVSEIRFMFGIMLVFTVPAALSLMRHAGLDFGGSFLEALFGVVTTFTTTGYSTTNYTAWPHMAMSLLLPLMLIGGCAGSTAGGIKMSRVYLLILATRENVRKRISSVRKVTAPSYNTVRGETPVDDAMILDVLGFIVCYMGLVLTGTLLVAWTAGCSPEEAFFEFTSAFGTVGISSGLTAHAGNATLIIEMAGMVLGRLEIFIVFVGIYEIMRTAKNAMRRLLEKRARPALQEEIKNAGKHTK